MACNGGVISSLVLLLNKKDISELSSTLDCTFQEVLCAVSSICNFDLWSLPMGRLQSFSCGHLAHKSRNALWDAEDRPG